MIHSFCLFWTESVDGHDKLTVNMSHSLQASKEGRHDLFLICCTTFPSGPDHEEHQLPDFEGYDDWIQSGTDRQHHIGTNTGPSTKPSHSIQQKWPGVPVF